MIKWKKSERKPLKKYEMQHKENEGMEEEKIHTLKL